MTTESMSTEPAPGEPVPGRPSSGEPGSGRSAVRAASSGADGALSPVLVLLRRGLAAGGLGGLASGLFSLLLAEPLMDHAIRLEERRESHEHAAAHGGHVHAGGEELFSRSTQHLGLVVAAVVTGLALGVFYAVTYALVHRADGPLTRRPWERALVLAGAGFLALALLPAVRYPANPPGVGQAGTVAERQTLWVSALVIGVLGMLLAWQLYVRLRDAGHGPPARQLAAAAAVLGTLGVLFLLPGNPDPVPVPAPLLWDFRVLSLASNLLLWATLGCVFGGLALRARRQHARGPRDGADSPARTAS